MAVMPELGNDRSGGIYCELPKTLILNGVPDYHELNTNSRAAEIDSVDNAKISTPTLVNLVSLFRL